MIKKAIFLMLNTLYIHKRYLKNKEDIMQNNQKRRFTVISNPNISDYSDIPDTNATLTIKEIHSPTKPTGDPSGYQTNPLYEKLLNFKELQKKKRFTVEDLLKW